MQLNFRNVLPIPLADTPLPAGSLWKSDTSFESQARCLVQAPSGTGKTTIISLLYGLRSDYDGQLLFDNQDVRTFSVDQWTEIRKQKLAVVFQDLRLFPQLTALENIQLKNELTKTLNEGRIREMAEQLGVAHKLDAPCGKLSLGQQQRIAIIRALAQPFELILLDEPFSHLDEANIRKAAELISQSCTANGAGLLLTSLGGNTHFDFTKNITI
ncbi:MAG: ATP-binding cassette domain-containing protein [Bacteroidia bacterium]